MTAKTYPVSAEVEQFRTWLGENPHSGEMFRSIDARSERDAVYRLLAIVFSTRVDMHLNDGYATNAQKLRKIAGAREAYEQDCATVKALYDDWIPQR